MQTARIAIIGAGLSGLYAAWLLESHGVQDYVLLEARDTLGGRIASASASGQDTRDVADAIDRFYKDSSFGALPGGTGSTETPKSGVTIGRDTTFGVPRIRRS